MQFVKKATVRSDDYNERKKKRGGWYERRGML